MLIIITFHTFVHPYFTNYSHGLLPTFNSDKNPNNFGIIFNSFPSSYNKYLKRFETRFARKNFFEILHLTLRSSIIYNRLFRRFIQLVSWIEFDEKKKNTSQTWNFPPIDKHTCVSSIHSWDLPSIRGTDINRIERAIRNTLVENALGPGPLHPSSRIRISLNDPRTSLQRVPYTLRRFLPESSALNQKMFPSPIGGRAIKLGRFARPLYFANYFDRRRFNASIPINRISPRCLGA